MNRSLYTICAAVAVWLACAHQGAEIAGTTNTGNARVTGAIVNESGTPHPGLAVELRRVVVTTAGDSIVWNQHTTTDNAGRYAFDFAPAGRYVLFCTSADRELTAAAGHVEHAGHSSTTVNLILHRPVTLMGRVLPAAPTALPGVAVHLPGTDISAVTDSAGEYRLAGVPAGRYDVCILINNVINYLPIHFGPEADGTVYLRDVIAARDPSDADSRYSFYDFLAADAYGIRPVVYPVDSTPAWYAGKDFMPVSYFSFADDSAMQIVDTVTVYKTMIVHDTVTVYDTITIDTLITVIDTLAPLPPPATGGPAPLSRSAAPSLGSIVFDTVLVFDTVTVFDTIPVLVYSRSYDTLWVDSAGVSLLLVDNFEVIDNVTTLTRAGFDSFWYAFTESSTVILPAGAGGMDIAPGIRSDGPNGNYLDLEYRIDSLDNMPPSGLGFALDRNGYVDFSGLKAFSFLIRGRGTIRLSVVTRAIQNYPDGMNWGHFSRVFDIPAQWTRIRIPVSELQPEPGSPPALDSLTWETARDSVHRVNFLTWVPGGDTVEISLDDVFLEGLRLEDL